MSGGRMAHKEAPWTLERFLAHALAIEEEAVLRYRELADQMEVHHNPEAARLFAELAAAEAEHAARVRDLVGPRTLPALAPWHYRWHDAESPEATPYDAAHHLLSPHHALRLAVAAEHRAERFFAAVAAQVGESALKTLAQEFAAEETLHAARLAAQLERTPAPPADWAVDVDPPQSLG